MLIQNLFQYIQRATNVLIYQQCTLLVMWHECPDGVQFIFIRTWPAVLPHHHLTNVMNYNAVQHRHCHITAIIYFCGLEHYWTSVIEFITVITSYFVSTFWSMTTTAMMSWATSNLSSSISSQNMRNNSGVVSGGVWHTSADTLSYTSTWGNWLTTIDHTQGLSCFVSSFTLWFLFQCFIIKY